MTRLEAAKEDAVEGKDGQVQEQVNLDPSHHSPVILTVYRYLLLKWKFSNVDVGHRTLRGEISRNFQGFFKEQVQAYHGDYGVACIQHALTGELAYVYCSCIPNI